MNKGKSKVVDVEHELEKMALRQRDKIANRVQAGFGFDETTYALFSEYMSLVERRNRCFAATTPRPYTDLDVYWDRLLLLDALVEDFARIVLDDPERRTILGPWTIEPRRRAVTVCNAPRDAGRPWGAPGSSEAARELRRLAARVAFCYHECRSADPRVERLVDRALDRLAHENRANDDDAVALDFLGRRALWRAVLNDVTWPRHPPNLVVEEIRRTADGLEFMVRYAAED